MTDASAVTRPLDVDPPGPGPVNALLLDAVHGFGARLRELAAEGRAGSGRGGRAPRVAGEPEALILAAAIEEMRRVLDHAFVGRPAPHRKSAGPGGPGLPRER